MARRISVAAASLISRDACSLYQAVWGVQIKLGASFRAPWEKLCRERETEIPFKPVVISLGSLCTRALTIFLTHIFVNIVCCVHLKGSDS